MIKREKTNSLVVMSLSKSHTPLRAQQIYDKLRNGNVGLLKEERVLSFKGFVKVLNTFPEVQQVPKTGIKMYCLRK